jgi:hypothetical protein
LKDYLIIYEHAEDGAWGAHSPDVDGVFALGQARREVESRMAEAPTARSARGAQISALRRTQEVRRFPAHGAMLGH